MLPTTRPHILDSFYGALCEQAPPRGATIFEITRFCLDRGLSARERRAVRDTLVTALVEHADGRMEILHWADEIAARAPEEATPLAA